MSLLLTLISKSDTPLDNLPEEIRAMIPYIKSLQDTITTLLDSDERDFEYRFTQTKMEFLSRMAQLGLIIGVRNDGVDIIKLLNETYSSVLSQIDDEISQQKSLGEPAAVAIAYAIEIIRDYFNLVYNTDIDIYIPEYNPAFDSYLDLSVCVSALVRANEDGKYKKHLDRLTRRCQEYAWQLESYVETIEIETDPEQKSILDRVKGQ
jgi:hypothetical protein